MKIAFCFSGQIRTWRKCLPTWKKLIEAIENHFQTKIDFFSHTWNFNTHPHIVIADTWTSPQYTLVSDQELQEYKESLNCVNFQVDDFEKSVSRYYNLQHISRAINFSEQNLKPVNLSWAASQFYSVMRSANLKKQYEVQNNIIYDIVFRLRNDLYFTDENIDQFVTRNDPPQRKPDLHYPEYNSIYSCHTGTDHKWPFIRLGDIFFYANSLTFDRMCDFYRWLPHLELYNIDPQISTEHSLFYYAKMMKIKIKPISIDPKICRTEEYISLKNKLGIGDQGGFEVV